MASSITLRDLSFRSDLTRHEHLYHQIEQKVIPSSEFPKGLVDTERRLGGSRVILCTMSMLCNQSMLSAGFTRVVPIRTVIVDEASQIEVGEYLPMLSQFQSSLQKLVFIGDDKQRMDSCCGRLITFSPFM